MRIILQKDVKNLGLAGDIVSVKKGYARHFLFPKKWAIPFTEGSAAEAKHRQELIESKKKKAFSSRQELVKKLTDIELSFIKEADEKGHLFGSLTVFEISKALQQKGFEVDKRAIKQDLPIKEMGEHKVLLDFSGDLKTEIKINISPSTKKTGKTKTKVGKVKSL